MTKVTKVKKMNMPAKSPRSGHLGGSGTMSPKGTLGGKYFLIFLISFTISAPVLAAAQPKGQVPNLPPIQAAPVNVKPNYSGSIQAVDPSHPINRPEDSKQVVPPPVHDESLIIDGTSYSKSSSWYWWVLVLVILAGAGLWVKHNINKV